MDALEEISRYFKGELKSISLDSLIVATTYNYLSIDYTRRLSVNVRLSTGTIVPEVILPLDLNSEQGIRDALRLVNAMLKDVDRLKPSERRFLSLLIKRLSSIVPNIRGDYFTMRTSIVEIVA
ncbi:MAG: hypothetical protein DRJ66_02305 [Thermoprotei archaeon]|nr:MAG: hypothetical protein DRJ66_02305 [Thermoprotei archaeon]RLF20266.1 MAG: hypothetical protein DRZ82_02895 [Thermoprotei archaeon]